MVNRGARNIALVSRSGINQRTQALMMNMEARNAKIAVYQCDVGNKDDVIRLIETISQEMPSIKGVIHSAMVLHVSLKPKPYAFRELTSNAGYPLRKSDIPRLPVNHPPQSSRHLEPPPQPLLNASRLLHHPLLHFRHHWQPRSSRLCRRKHLPRRLRTIPPLPKPPHDIHRPSRGQRHRIPSRKRR